MALLMEMRLRDGSWSYLGSVEAGEPAGSVSDNAGAQREVIRFRVEQGRGVVERSRGGMDIETGAQRAIISLLPDGFEELARLGEGESYERAIQTDRMRQPVSVRWRMDVKGD